MSAKNLVLFFIILFALISCQQNQQFPQKQFIKTDLNQIIINDTVRSSVNATADSIIAEKYSEELNEVLINISYYEELDSKFNLESIENQWGILKSYSKTFGFNDIKKWIEISGFLLELTGKTIYAEELEKTWYLSSHSFSDEDDSIIKELIVPYIYTKNVDHIQVNLFVNSAIKYEHTLKGAVEITQETDYPDTGEVEIKFQMENKRYIELYIRVPEWAENVSIIEKGVKYVAIPGEYSQIVRKWKEGNVVDINFSMKNKPEWLR